MCPMGVRLFSPRSLHGSESVGTSSLPYGRWREASALLLFAGALFVTLALASFEVDPNDPQVHGSDLSGVTGACIARYLVQGFGAVAWLLPVELVFVGLPLLRGRTHPQLGLRVAGDLVVAIVLAALGQVAVPDGLVFGRAPFAGNVGLLFGELMREAFSTAGSFLVGPTVVALILIGRSSFSFIAFAERLSLWMRRIFALLAGFAGRVADAFREAAELRFRERSARKERPPVPIERPDPDALVLLQLASDDTEFQRVERTGVPPLTVSEALKKRRRSLTDEAETPTQAGPEVLRLAQTPAPDAAAQEDTAGTRPRRSRRQKPKLDEARNEDRALEEAEPTLSVDARGPEPQPPEAQETGAPASEVGEREPSRSRGKRSAEEPAPAESAPEPPSPRSSEPEIVDTQHERAVERAEITVAPVRDDFRLPAFDLLEESPPNNGAVSEEKLRENGVLLVKTLLDYGVQATVEAILPGPTVTLYEVSCEAGTKVSKVAALADDLALGLSRKVRIIAPIPGKNRIGFELPNEERIPVSLRELVEDQRFERLAEKAPLPVVLGRDIVGKPFYADLASMPHVIVAGATGAGKSVGLNVMLSSLLFKRTPQELRLLMIDPKVVELAPFDGIPHMLLPVVTDMKQAATALRWAVDEMERRYQLFANAGTKNISTYNLWVKRVQDGELPPPKPGEVEALSPEGAVISVPAAKQGSDGTSLPGKLPFIVVVVDEFADLMMQQGKEVEASVARLAQKARAAGMHVVLATQRPSVDVITGMIKANFPTRIGFRVAQKVDSRTILDEQGAEHLLGRGDMLVKLNGSTETYRVQCPFVSEEEVSRLTDYLRAQATPQYYDAILTAKDDDDAAESDEEPLDPRFDEACRIVADTQRCSTSWLQRKMTIGYNRAAKIVEMMEKRGMVGPPNGARDREVFLPPI
ncbi:MAG TPA: DNA translocase FtsK [Polyangiaceae bacterium]|nr:DNA translocase FtsK [Polyangiaceae bacterium]